MVISTRFTHGALVAQEQTDQHESRQLQRVVHARHLHALRHEHAARLLVGQHEVVEACDHLGVVVLLLTPLARTHLLPEERVEKTHV